MGHASIDSRQVKSAHSCHPVMRRFMADPRGVIADPLWLGSFVRLDVAESGQQRQVIRDLQRTACDQRRGAPSHPRPNKPPASVGATAAARLRGTDVKLAAAARSAGVTTAIT